MAAAVGQALDEARFDGAREKLLARLPQGMTIAHDGSIGGSTRITGIPIGAKGLKDFEGLTTAQFVDRLATAGIAPKTNPDGSSKPLGSIAGIPVAGQASNDLYRLDLTIDTGARTYVSRQDPETGEAERNKTAVRQLRAFAGSDQATTVLSGIVNQQVLRPLSDGMTRPDGAQAQVALDHHGAAGKVKQPDGSFDDVRMFNMGSASFALSKTPDGDFRVSVDWPMFIVDTERGGHEHALPGMRQGEAIVLNRVLDPRHLDADAFGTLLTGFMDLVEHWSRALDGPAFADLPAEAEPTRPPESGSGDQALHGLHIIRG